MRLGLGRKDLPGGATSASEHSYCNRSTDDHQSTGHDLIRSTELVTSRSLLAHILTMKTSSLVSLALVAFSQTFGAHANPEASRVERSDATKVIRAEKGKQSPSMFPVPEELKPQGCFEAAADFSVMKGVDFLSSGSCGKICTDKKFKVMALHGAQCLCGNKYPPKSSLAKDSKCFFPCPAYPDEACGSLGDPGAWSVFNTGIDVNVDFTKEEKKDKDDKDDDDKDEKKPSSSATSSATSTSAGATAPAATESNGSGDDKKEEKKGPNVAGIAAGVVVGVVAIAVGVGGIFFWMRRRRNAEIEEDHRRNAAVNAFINGSKPPSSHGSISMTDSRLDPVMANRRMSDGSIADNQDYSRRILRV